MIGPWYTLFTYSRSSHVVYLVVAAHDPHFLSSRSFTSEFSFCIRWVTIHLSQSANSQKKISFGKISVTFQRLPQFDVFCKNPKRGTKAVLTSGLVGHGTKKINYTWWLVDLDCPGGYCCAVSIVSFPTTISLCTFWSCWLTRAQRDDELCFEKFMVTIGLPTSDWYPI